LCPALDQQGIAPHLGRQSSAAVGEFCHSQFRRTGGAPGDEVRDATPELQQCPLLRRYELAIGETYAVKGGPESISGTREVVAGGCGIQTRIDATEQDLQVRSDDVGNRHAFGGD